MKNTSLVFILLTVIWEGFRAITAGVYVKYLNLHGLDVFETNLVNMVFYFSLILFDVPTGAYADVCGRKKSVILAGMSFALASFVYGISSNVQGFCLAEILAALGVTFNNGALSSWLVDRMHHQQQPLNKAYVFAKAKIYAQLISIATAALGGWLMAKSSSLPWFIESIGVLIFSLCAFFLMKEEYLEPKNFSVKHSYELMRLNIQSSFNYLKENSVVRFIVFSSMIQVFATQAPNMQWIPKFESVIGGAEYLGMVFSAFFIALMIGSYIGAKLVSVGFDESRLIKLTQLLIGALLIASAIAPPKISLLIFVFHQIPRGMYMPIKNAFLHDHIPSDVRATLSSFESVFPNLGGMVALLTTGAMGKYFGLTFTWVFSGLALIIIALYLKKPVYQKPLSNS